MRDFVVQNCVSECTFAKWEPKHSRSIDKITTIVVHRIGPKIPEDTGKVMTCAKDIARWYYDNPVYTGARMPYHFIITPAGTIQQAVQLHWKAPGAKRLNSKGIQIACIGDFRKHTAPVAQAMALTELCTELCVAFGSLKVIGHTEESGTTENPGKVCPGHHLNMNGLRRIVSENLATERLAHLEHRGILP